MSMSRKRLEQEANDKTGKGSKGENYNCSKDDTEYFQNMVLLTLVWLRNPARKISLQPFIHLGWAAKLLSAFKTHLKC